ncbi:alpha-galactosidase [Marinomonas agarivorans]|nr:alpha-galactosidase [Marinomonas agarivorans]
MQFTEHFFTQQKSEKGTFLKQDHNWQTLVLFCPKKGAPELLYFGAKLPADTNLVALHLSQQPSTPQAMLDEPAPLSLLPETGRGWLASPAVEVVAEDRAAWSPCWELEQTLEQTHGYKLFLRDTNAELSICLAIGITDQGLLSQKLTLVNQGKSDIKVQRLAMTMPVPSHFTKRMSFYGRWCQEFQQNLAPWFDNWVQENRAGRNSHANFPCVIVGDEHFSELHGEVYGMHLAFSGNHRLKADYTIEGHRYLQAEALYLPGEITLHSGESLTTPVLYVSASETGLNGMSHQFHEQARSITKLDKPRPVHLNTWEAFYFDHDMEQLKALADAAASVGVERYILDDGWFKGRNGERAALGDWFVDETKYPNGLSPLIQHVKQLGMEFGLWFEPEMVNPDSDLFRNHPEWALQLPNYDTVLGRYQLVLNLANPEAYAYIRERLFTLLGEYDIDYVKWDMNREYVQPGTDVAPQAHAQVEALYKLLGELNKAFPQVEFESCASGGARVDFGILQFTKRFWASDCNDALERHSIQRGFSYFFPPELMGSHIGPDKSHTTSRVHDVSFRAGTALLGHLGIEWNLLEATVEQKAVISSWIAQYKSVREILHTGNNWRLPSADGRAQANWALSKDRQKGLLAYAQLTMPKQAQPLPVRLPDLIPDQLYKVTVLEQGPMPHHLMKKMAEWWDSPLVLNGASLTKLGLQLPILDPESLVLLAIEATSAK